MSEAERVVGPPDASLSRLDGNLDHIRRFSRAFSGSSVRHLFTSDSVSSPKCWRPTSTGCSLTLCLLAAAATDVASALRSTATIGSSLNRRFLTGSTPPKRHLPRNPRSENAGGQRMPSDRLTSL